MKNIVFPTILMFFLFFYSNSYTQTIVTVAGNGMQGFSGDGGLATVAEMWQPYNVVFDSAGNMYIADGNNNRIRMVNTTGIISTFAGDGYGAPDSGGFSGDGGPATSAELYYPSIAIDKNGNLFIADYGSNRIRKVNNLGIITTIAGTGVAGDSGDGGQADTAALNGPANIIFDKNGNLYISEWHSNKIRKIDTSGIITTYAGNGISGYSGDGGPALSAKFNEPTGMAFDAAGNAYICDVSNSVIRKIDAAGNISTFAGSGVNGYSGDGQHADSAKFNTPFCLDIDSSGNFYIADYGNNRIRKINTSGIITTFAGTGIGGYNGDGEQADSAELKNPYSVTVHGGELYISDYFNQRVRKVSLASTTGITAITNNQTIQVYPNPSTGIVKINMPFTQGNSVITINDVCGRLMISKQVGVNENIVSLDLRFLPRGTYLLKLQNTKNVMLQKIILE